MFFSTSWGVFKCFKYYLNLNLCIAVHCTEDIVYKYCSEHNIHIWARGTEFSFQKIESLLSQKWCNRTCLKIYLLFHSGFKTWEVALKKWLAKILPKKSQFYFKQLFSVDTTIFEKTFCQWKHEKITFCFIRNSPTQNLIKRTLSPSWQHNFFSFFITFLSLWKCGRVCFVL